MNVPVTKVLYKRYGSFPRSNQTTNLCFEYSTWTVWKILKQHLFFAKKQRNQFWILHKWTASDYDFGKKVVNNRYFSSFIVKNCQYIKIEVLHILVSNLKEIIQKRFVLTVMKLKSYIRKPVLSLKFVSFYIVQTTYF